MSSTDNGLRRIRSAVSPGVSRRPSDAAYTGPLSGPTDPTWRRQRLLNIGTDSQPDFGSPSTPAQADGSAATPRGERAVLRTDTIETYTYGTVPYSPSHGRRLRSRISLGSFGRNLQNISIPRYSSLNSQPPSTGAISPNSVGEYPSVFRPSRPLYPPTLLPTHFPCHLKTSTSSNL